MGMWFQEKVFLLLCLVSLGLPLSIAKAQSQRLPTAEPSLPGYSSFHSNLGILEIIEVGLPISQGRAAVESSPLLENEPPKTEGKKYSFSASAGSRLYRTSNVLRTPVHGQEERSGVFEANLGLSLSRSAMELGEYISIIPRIDLMVQRAEYDRYSALLDNRFGMVKSSLAFGLPRDWSMGASVEYNILHNQKTGDRTFDAIAPAWSVQKTIPLTDSSFLMSDFMVKYSSTDQTMTFPAAGVYADSGDNYQNSISTTYIHMLGEEGQLMIMPRIGLNRTHYLKSPSKGRDDYLLTLGSSFIYQWTDWLSVQSFITHSSMSSDESSVDGFKALDTGFSLNANISY
jgi:hypothetical protein